MDRLEDIQRRLDLLEAGLNEVRALVQLEQSTASPVSPPVTPPPSPAPAYWTGARPPTPAPLPALFPPAPAPPKPSAPRSGDFEANLLGSWFARAGAIAIFLGSVFAFRYAVDRNLISPAGRVAIGLMVGLAFAGWGEWAHRKTWPLFAQAVAGGGVAISYLSIWAGYQLYDLMAPGTALALLAVVVIGGGALAVRHDSVPLAVMASLGGFLNPILVSTGRGSDLALYTYVLLLDLGILGLAMFRRWRALNAVALFFTWLLVLAGAASFPTPGGHALARLGFATSYLLLFHAVCLAGKATQAGPSDDLDLGLIGVNAAAFFFFGLLVLEFGAHSTFALLVGLAHIGAGLTLRQRTDSDPRVVLTLVGLGVSALTIAAGLQFTGPILSTVLGIEAVLLVAASKLGGLSKLRYSALAVFALSVVTSLGGYRLGFAYDPELPLASIESLPFITQIFALAAGGSLLRRRSEPEAKTYADVGFVSANLMTLLWFSFELWAAYERSAGWSIQGFTFTLSSVWTLYASALLAFGISLRARWARLLAVGIFVLVVAKLVMADIWLLETPLRIAAFMGLGLVLLLCSLGYHRFRTLILGPDNSNSPT